MTEYCQGKPVINRPSVQTARLYRWDKAFEPALTTRGYRIVPGSSTRLDNEFDCHHIFTAHAASREGMCAGVRIMTQLWNRTRESRTIAIVGSLFGCVCEAARKAFIGRQHASHYGL